MICASATTLRSRLEQVYRTFNRRELVEPDPLQFLYRYPAPEDREVVGLIAALLAYGNVKQIVRSVETALEPLGDQPAAFIRSARSASLMRIFSMFKHRFTTGTHMTQLLRAVRHVLQKHGSLEACFRTGFHEGDETIVPALTAFTAELTKKAVGIGTFLISSPTRGSACKRLNLFLRWMVRRDAVDPGGWTGIPAAALVVPLDTHMSRICRVLGLTQRRQDDLRTALEITRQFKAIEPEDPVKYDFALTRLGIHRLPVMCKTTDS